MSDLNSKFIIVIQNTLGALENIRDYSTQIQNEIHDCSIMLQNCLNFWNDIKQQPQNDEDLYKNEEIIVGLRNMVRKTKLKRVPSLIKIQNLLLNEFKRRIPSHELLMKIKNLAMVCYNFIDLSRYGPDFKANIDRETDFFSQLVKQNKFQNVDWILIESINCKRELCIKNLQKRRDKLIKQRKQNSGLLEQIDKIKNVQGQGKKGNILSHRCLFYLESKTMIENVVSECLALNIACSSVKYGEVLKKDIENTIISSHPEYNNVKCYIFGSRASGLALSHSDFDVYVDIDGDQFNNILTYKKQQDLVKELKVDFENSSKAFKHVDIIPYARVPLLKLFHIASSKDIDINFKDSISIHSTELLNFYLSLNRDIQWLILSFKMWILLNSLHSRRFMNSNTINWFILFYLMNEKVIPSVHDLQKDAVPNYIGTWNVSFDKCKTNVKAKIFDKFEMFKNLINFIINENFDSNMLCTHTGQLISKELFKNMEQLSLYENGIFEKYVSNIKNKDQMKGKPKKDLAEYQLIQLSGLCIQHPFEFSNNISIPISKGKCRHLKRVAQATFERLEKIKYF